MERYRRNVSRSASRILGGGLGSGAVLAVLALALLALSLLALPWVPQALGQGPADPDAPLPPPKPPASTAGLEVLKIVLGQHDVPMGGQQLVQVTLRNTSRATVRAGLRMDLRNEKDVRVGKAINRVTQVRPQDEQREFFRFAVPPRPGKYTVRMEVFTPDFKRKLLAGDPVFYSPFTIGLEAVAESPRTTPGAPGARTPAGPQSFAPPQGLSFEKPDLVWENLDVQPTNVLLGEPLKIKADLRNVGGDIARNIDVQVEYYNLRSPARREPVTRSSVLVLGPGDKVEMEFEMAFPAEITLGDYAVLLQIDPERKVPESQRDNNVAVSETPIHVTQIKLVFPETGFAFDESGLFLFRWDSRKFDEFKVQLGTDPNFALRDSFFDLPQGDKWTREHEIVPLEGELPGMGLGLMQKNRATTLYWRVTGRNAAGNDGRSLVQPFIIRRESKAPAGRAAGGEPPAERRSAAPEPKKDQVQAPRAVKPGSVERPAAAPKDIDEPDDAAEKPAK